MPLQWQCGPHLLCGRKIDRRDPREHHLLGFARSINGLRRFEDFKTNRCTITTEIHYDAWSRLVAFADSCLAKRDRECVRIRILFDFHVQSTTTG
jgi:hypothetical protein